MTFKVHIAEHLIPPPAPLAPARNRQFIAVLAGCFLIHAALLAFLLREDQSVTPAAPPMEEIPVELVTEIPPVEKIEPPPAPPPPAEKQPKQKVKDDEKPAFDAPRAANKDTIEREAPDKETQAPRVAPPTKHTAPEPAPAKTPAAPQEAVIEPAPQAAPPKPADENPNAEALDKAEPASEVKPEEKQQAPAKIKAPPVKAKTQTVADQLAALSALPDYRVGSAAKPAPVSGGTANTTYLSILFGLIMRQMHVPPAVPASHVNADGIVAFYIDEIGHLTHQAVYKASGRPDLDAAALAAVRHAAPFPAPPRGDPHAIWFHYDTR
jgi:protein TonB